MNRNKETRVDFKNGSRIDFKDHFWSLRTDEFEYCVEPLLFTEFHVAKYDLDEHLIGYKKRVDGVGAKKWMKKIISKEGKKFKLRGV